MKLDTYLTPYTKINSKLFKHPNLKTKIINPSKENIDQNLMTLDLIMVSQISQISNI